MRTAALLALFSSVALGDVILKNAGTAIGPVTSINCAPDAGLFCVRDAGSVGTIRCTAANAVEPGCITPSAQTFSGEKTFTADVILSPVAHGSLVACDANHKGMRQTCSTHSAQVFCDGTTNLETNGSQAAEKVLGVINVNGIPVSLMGGAFTLQTAATITAIEGSWFAGTTSDGGTVVMRMSDGSNFCDCAVPCDVPTTRTSCSGSCSYAAGVTITPSRNKTTCTTNPYVGGELLVKGAQ